jgi:hypothetical protein
VLVNNAITTVTNTSTGGAIASYAISPAAPAGLTFNTSTGQLSGTPTSTQSATNYTITATNASGSATQTFSLTVTVTAPAFSISSSAETRVATTALVGYSITSTGGAISSYALTGILPAGLSFSTSTGLITGTPTETKTATTYTITATNASGSTTRNYALRVTGDVGDTGPGGGKIFYYLSAGFTCGPTRAATCTYLEAAPSGWNTGAEPGRTWAQATPVNYQGTRVPGDSATATAIGWGYRNTRAIVAQGNTDTATSAAALADSHTVTVSGVVYDDWFLPSKDELAQLYSQKATVGGFAENNYWSSSEAAAEAWYQSFSGGGQGGAPKGFAAYYVRPVRAF